MRKFLPLFIFILSPCLIAQIKQQEEKEVARLLIVNNAINSFKDAITTSSLKMVNDGQVWAQTEEDAIKRPVRWRQPANSMRVSISQGAMGTFNLVVGDENRSYKVKRIR